jgi:hypothetical protein
MADVFISYPHEASRDASQFASALKAKGLDTWYAEENLAPGSDWKKEISSALSSANAVVFIVTPDYEPSSWQQEEYMTALESYWSGGKKLLIPILVGEAAPPKFLQHKESLKIGKKSDWERAANQLISLLQMPQGVPIQPTKQAQRERTPTHAKDCYANEAHACGTCTWQSQIQWSSEPETWQEKDFQSGKIKLRILISRGDNISAREILPLIPPLQFLSIVHLTTPMRVYSMPLFLP